MDDKFLRDKINDDDIEVPEPLRPENIAKLLDADVSVRNGMKDADGKINAQGFDDGKNSGKHTDVKRFRSMAGHIKSLALAAAAIIVVVTWASMATRINSNKTSGEVQTDEGSLCTTIQETTAIMETRAAGDMSMKKSKYDELYEKLVQGYAGYDDGKYILNDVDGYPSGDETKAYYQEPENAITTGDDTSADGTDYSRNNDQEEGVSEGNIFITDGSYLYVMTRPDDVYAGTRSVAIYAADKDKLTKCGEIAAEKVNDTDYVSYEAMYVSGNMLVLTGYAYIEDFSNGGGELSFGVFYDISDRTAPRYVSTVTQSGYYVSSRITDGILYLVSSYRPSANCQPDELEKYIPMYDGEIAGADNIYCPEYVNDRCYTVIGSVDLSSPAAYKDTEAVVLNSDNMYVSQNAIYFLSYRSEYAWWNIQPEEDSQESKNKSTLMKFAIDDGDIEFVGETKVCGSADSQFSFSEYNGYIRLVTTTYDYADGVQSCGLYIFDENLKQVGSIDGLAEGESVKSVRFLGDMAYFVTFRNTDPLFAVDISQPDNPVMVGEIKLPGFSEYLHPYGEGKLLGLGYEADETNGRLQNVKLSMFDVSNPVEIKELDRVQLDSYYSGAMYEHRAMLVNADRNLIGFVTEENIIDTDETGANITGRLAQVYRLYSYDENDGFVQHIECVLDLYSYDYPRAVYIGDYLYIFDGAENIYTYDLKDYEFLGKTEL